MNRAVKDIPEAEEPTSLTSADPVAIERGDAGDSVADGTAMIQSGGDMSKAGDLGRRIFQRRTELNLSADQVGERAGMAAGYLDYVEQNPNAQLSGATLTRLALALEISNSDLLGGEQGQARGHERAARNPVLLELDRSDCEDLIRNGGVGRVVFRWLGKPIAFPVNFRTLEGDIVVCSTADGLLSAVAPSEPFSFEVDRIDDAMSEGWSVLATGTLHQVRNRDELIQIEELGIEPWAGGERSVYFRLNVTSLTGKRINAVR